MLVPSWNALKWDPAVRRACAHLLRIHKILKLFKYFLLSFSLERKHPQYTELTGCIQQVTSPTGSHPWLHQGCFYAVLSTRCESEIKTWIRENNSLSDRLAEKSPWKPGFVGDSDGKATRWGHVDVSVWSTDDAETMRCWTRLNAAFVPLLLHFPAEEPWSLTWLGNDRQTFKLVCKGSAGVLDCTFLNPGEPFSPCGNLLRRKQEAATVTKSEVMLAV